MTARLACSLSIVCLLAGAARADDVQPPGDFLGHPVGADFELPDWAQVSGYFQQLAQQSERVQVERVGTSTEGRPFLLATISSPENLARLAEVRRLSRRLADPRGLEAAERAALLERAPLTLFVSCQMHSTETAGSSFGMEFAYTLATSDQEPWVSARRELVVLMTPSTNPDGIDHVARWYRETKDTPHEGAWLLELYQLYAGHDNNRDWFGLTQAESRIVTRLLYTQWFPQVYWDVHQQGQGEERFFLPPYRDPLNPNLDPGIIAGIDALGSRALLDMTREGLSGISTGVTYDMWWNGGNRNVPVRHNIIGILTEAASVNLGSPVFLAPSELKAPGDLGAYGPSTQFPDPWPGGWWRLRDIIDYEMAFARSLLGSLSRERRVWLENALEAAERAVAPDPQRSPVAWLIPATNRDRGAVRRLVDGLLLGGVEVQRATAPLRADGRTWPAGTLVIPAAQPYGQHVKDLFEVQRYPEGDPPYDVAGWSFPLLLGVHRVEVAGELQAQTEPVRGPDQALNGFPLPPNGQRFWDAGDSDTWTRVFPELLRGERLRFATQGEHAGRFTAQELGEDSAAIELDRLPRLGVYHPDVGIKNEGWLRWVLDTRGLPYTRVSNAMLRAGDLGALLDVLILPSVTPGVLDAGRAPGTVPDRYTRGLDPEGAVAIEAFVREGGTLIALDQAATWTRDLLELPLRDATEPDEDAEEPQPAFACPGSVLRAVPEPHPLTAGLPTNLAVYFSRSLAWELDLADDADEADAPEVLLRYAPTRLLLSGWIQGPEVIGGQAAWVRARHGAGRVHLFGFRPQYRGWSQQAFQLLFRAAVLDR